MENRLARLNPRARRLLQVAAVLRREFDIALLTRVSAEPDEWVEICLTNWINRGLVVEMETADGEERDDALPAPRHRYRFSHGFLWQGAQEELTQLQQERLIERINAVRAAPRGAETITPLANRRAIEENGQWKDEIGGR